MWFVAVSHHSAIDYPCYHCSQSSISISPFVTVSIHFRLNCGRQTPPPPLINPDRPSERHRRQKHVESKSVLPFSYPPPPSSGFGGRTQSHDASATMTSVPCGFLVRVQVAWLLISYARSTLQSHGKTFLPGCEDGCLKFCAIMHFWGQERDFSRVILRT